MDVIIMHQTVTGHDAIGNDIEGMYSLLSKICSCYVYAENCLNKAVEYIDQDKLLSLIIQEDCLVIYHHSVYWQEGQEILKYVMGSIIIRYHNITPPEFFEPYNPFHHSQCQKGRAQTEELVREFSNAFWLADSEYNTLDIRDVPRERIAVCPPFHKIEEWSKKLPDETLLRTLMESEEINLLFVGRIAPNKGHMMLLEILGIFCQNYADKIKLRVVGKFDEGLPDYNNKITDTIARYGLTDSVEFIGEINDSTLMAYYLGSDFFVCASEHEGFCVPVVEAQFFGLPVLALDECAVGETIGKNQLLFDRQMKKFASAIRLIYKNDQYYEYLSEAGYENYHSRFSREKIEQQFEEVILKRTGEPK